MPKMFLIILTLLLLAGTLLPFLRVDSFWIRVFDFPRSQIAFMGVLLTSLWFFFYNGESLTSLFFVLSLLFCLAYQFSRIYPYTPLHPRQVQWTRQPDPTRCVSLLISNVLMENHNIEPYLQIVARMNPDIILAVETDQWWVERLSQLKCTYPHAVLKPQNNHYGMMLLSRLPLVNADIRFLVENDIPSVHASVQLRSGDVFLFYGLHPRPPHPYPLTDTTMRDAELIVVGKAVKEEKEPAIVAGDLNDVAWSHTTSLFQHISGLLDPRIGRGMYNTFHAANPLFRWPLDHVFHSHHFQLVALERLPAFGSDHFPVYIKLSYEPHSRQEQPRPVATMEDRQEANEKIENAEEATGRSVESPQEESIGYKRTPGHLMSML